MLKRFFASAIVLVLFATLAMAQTDIILHGRVADAQTGKPLPGANVFIVPAGAGAISDADGRFKFKALVGSADSLRASFMGYRYAGGKSQPRIQNRAPSHYPAFR
jgi:protocatechuate 3,4-dioxygenase beta subunit